ncbi:MAG TPA: phospholipase D family protein [Planococcus sp. (in: firmicutes)]|nr:phospholipase D family protein [Planococcus sp. (in: firmicutes)]
MMKKRVKGWSKRRKIIYATAGVLAIMYLIVIMWHTYKPLPEGISYEGELRNLENVEMLYDLSYAQDKEGTQTEYHLEIFDEIFTMIDEAEEFIVMDLFLFDNYNDQKIDYPAISELLTDHLLKKKEENPDMPIYFISDPLNIGYGSYENQFFDSMDNAGIEIIITDLDKLRDSMPLYSGFYRVIFQWFDTGGRGWVPNSMSSDAPDLSIASYLTMLNIKANHRKVVITEKEAIISSANPHNASGLHGNMAFKVSGEIINDLLEAEEAVSKFSGGPEFPRIDATEAIGEYQAQYLTEKKILDALLADIAKAEEGDDIRLGMFYVAQAEVVDALEDAANRGVDVRMILDPNENAFGREKTGLPNRPVVNEILGNSDNNVQVRWYNAIVGQYHTKTMMIKTAEETYIYGGSANYTERTLDNYNLESDIRIIAPNDSDLTGKVDGYFNMLWDNEDALYTLDVEEYQDDFTFWQRGIYAFQKLFKLTTY